MDALTPGVVLWFDGIVTTNSLGMYTDAVLWRRKRATGFLAAFAVSIGLDSDHNLLQPLFAELSLLSSQLGCVPRDDLYTYALFNGSDDEEPLTFTGSKQEVLFIEGIRNCMIIADKILLIIEDADFILTNDVTEEILELMRAYHKHMLSYLTKNDEGIRNLEVDVFRNELRHFFPPFSVGGEEFSPPTAANAVPVMLVDLALGHRDTWYVDHIDSRINNMSNYDAVRWNRAVNTPGLLQRWEKGIIVSRVERENLLAILSAWKKASAAHWMLVQNYLEKPNQEETSCPMGYGSSIGKNVDPEKGTSNMAFSEVLDIHEMRSGNPLMAELILFNEEEFSKDSE